MSGTETMRAVWHEQTGPARDVMEVGDVGRPTPEYGDVLVRLYASGVNPADTNRRGGRGWHSNAGRTIPHVDGAGAIEGVGAGVDPRRIGERVWTYMGAAGRQSGTAAQYTVFPADIAAPLDDALTFTEGACLGVPAMTAHRCLFADGSITGLDILITGGAGGVGQYAIQLAKWAGARVITTVSSHVKAEMAREAGADHIVNYRTDDVAAAVRDIAPGGVDRIVEVDFGGNLETSLAVLKTGGIVATYASRGETEPTVPVYPLMRLTATAHFVLLPNEPAAARARAQADISRWIASGPTIHRIARTFPLAETAAAHEFVEAGGKTGCAIVEID